MRCGFNLFSYMKMIKLAAETPLSWGLTRSNHSHPLNDNDYYLLLILQNCELLAIFSI